MSSQPMLQGLYAITDANLLPDERLFSAVSEAISGGARLIQYRDKQADVATRLQRAQRLQQLCQSLGCPLIINDDLELAAKVGAAGVHLGRNDGAIASARQRLGPAAIVGATCHGSLQFAEEAKQQGASYVAFGACFASPTKPQAQRVDLSIFQQARAQIGLPVVAIGGIELSNAAQVLAAGADMLAVVSGIFAHSDVRANVQAFAKLFAPL